MWSLVPSFYCHRAPLSLISSSKVVTPILLHTFERYIEHIEGATCAALSRKFSVFELFNIHPPLRVVRKKQSQVSRRGKGCVRGNVRERRLTLNSSFRNRFCRFVGTQIGLPISTIILWWHWPEAHGFVLHPLSIILIGTGLVCDIAYPFLLAHVRTTERVLPDGMIISGYEATSAEEKKRL